MMPVQNDLQLIDKLTTDFRNAFKADPQLVRSPGRVNLIGEHTDYNNGFVLPAAINKNIYLAISKREDDEINLISSDLNDGYSTFLKNLQKSNKLWPDYILGVADQFIKAGHKLNGFNIIFAGDIPQGAGLSSSAALECATAYALNQLFNLGITPIGLVKAAQAAENQFVGVRCGIMDQFASMFGKKQNLIKIDCKTLAYEYIPFRAPDIKIVLFNTKVTHSLASSAYNERREQCEKGAALIRQKYAEVESLREASTSQLNELVKPVDELVYQRCLYVVEEIQRLHDACNDLQNNDLASFGRRMFQTHNGLQNLYEVSCKELDVLVDLVRDNEAVYGARMMGGGFGGCTINLVKAEQVELVIEQVTRNYQLMLGKVIEVYVAELEDGTEIITQ